MASLAAIAKRVKRAHTGKCIKEKEKSKLTVSQLERLFDENHFVVTCEICPPHGADPRLFITKVQNIKEFCDAINVTDNVRGIPTMDSLVCSHFVLQAGAEPVMQISARDRNRINLESVLFGAYALGIHNLLFVTGDHVAFGTHPEAKMVNDFDSIIALSIASKLMTGVDLSNQELEGIPSFYLGSTFNPFEQPMNIQVQNVEKKCDCGARFFQTQAIYDTSRFEEFMDQIRDFGANVLAGIIPLKSPEMAHFMNEHIPGITVPAFLIERLALAGDGLSLEEQQDAIRQEGVNIALETIETVRRIKGVRGIHIMPIGWDGIIPVLVKQARLYPRPK